MYKKAEPLYGAPRGNRVMAAKRTTGPSAKRVLETHIVLERCGVKGCSNPPLATKNPTGTERVRRCAEHVSTVQREVAFNVRDLLKLPWE